jgi:hypothetical protein
MTTMTDFFKTNPVANLFKRDENEVYYVVHPLYDEPEEKCDPEALGPMHLSKGERLSLYALRGYLILMLGLAAYRVLDMAGVFAPHLVH